jgi:ACT domain-containing protein
MKKVVITVVGKDSVGIIAKVCTLLAETGINILDISQTITGGFFNMMMIVDLSEAKITFSELQEKLDEIGKEIGVEIHAQKEEIFDMMHRV